MLARSRMFVVMTLALAGCQATPPAAPEVKATGPAPRACDMAGFGAAPGQNLPEPKKAPSAKNKSEPLKYADKVPLNLAVATTGKWVDAGNGWSAWRYWLHSELARTLSVHVQPFVLPPDAQFWLCSSDQTTRKGPLTAKGFVEAGQYWSPELPGPEIWLEILTPAGSEKDVNLVIAEAFAGTR